MLRPPSGSFAKMPRSIRTVMSRWAVSGEHLVIFAHREVVIRPPVPSKMKLSTLRWRALTGLSWRASQNRARKHRRERRLSRVNCASQAGDEPEQPDRDVEMPFLRQFKVAKIGVAFQANLRGHAVETLRRVFRSIQQKIGDRARSGRCHRRTDGW